MDSGPVPWALGLPCVERHLFLPATLSNSPSCCSDARAIRSGHVCSPESSRPRRGLSETEPRACSSRRPDTAALGVVRDDVDEVLDELHSCLAGGKIGFVTGHLA